MLQEAQEPLESSSTTDLALPSNGKDVGMEDRRTDRLATSLSASFRNYAMASASFRSTEDT